MTIAKSSKNSNASIAFFLIAIVIAMAGLAYASVPLYRLFCQVTGFGGTTQVAEQESATLGSRKLAIQFDANIDSNLPWEFKPLQHEVEVTTGENTLVFYTAKNNSDEPVTGVATFNVTPDKVGSYFNKVQCFCFDEQTLQPGEEVDMPISFFVDPEIEQDKDAQDVKTITLSYTFFRSKNEKVE